MIRRLDSLTASLTATVFATSLMYSCAARQAPREITATVAADYSGEINLDPCSQGVPAQVALSAKGTAETAACLQPGETVSLTVIKGGTSYQHFTRRCRISNVRATVFRLRSKPACVSCSISWETPCSLWFVLRDQFEPHQLIVFVRQVSNELSNWRRQRAKHGWQGCQIFFNSSAGVFRHIDNFNFVLTWQFLFTNLFEVLNGPARPAFLTSYVNPPDMGGFAIRKARNTKR